MEPITVQELLTAVQGSLRGDCKNLSALVNRVETDSRKLQGDEVFFALIGENHNAHQFLQGISSGHAFVISQELSEYHHDKCYIMVEDTEKALGDLAKWYRNRFQIPFLAVTGSVGKTTAKDMIASVLSQKYQVHKTQGNFNNTIGLPLTVLNLEAHHEICVLELGMDTLGEIDYMANIVKPELAVITNIGDAHIERLGSREQIRKAKFELLPHLSSTGLLLLNGDDPLLSQGELDFSFSTILLGSTKDFPYMTKEIVADSAISLCCTVKTPQNHCKVQVPAMGTHMQYPLLFAMAVGEHYGLSQEEILSGVAQFVPSKMRMNLLHFSDNITILDDCYNANPQSMKAAVEILSGFSEGKTIAVLGDMLELGDVSIDRHRDIGRQVAESGIDLLLTLGEHSQHIADSAQQHSKTIQVKHCNNKEVALNAIETELCPHSTILFKASRGMTLNTLVTDSIAFLEKSHTQQ